MGNRSGILIKFFLGGALFATRCWPLVPRVGDEVLLPDIDNGTLIRYEVTNVVWDSINDFNTQTAEVHVSW